MPNLSKTLESVLESFIEPEKRSGFIHKLTTEFSKSFSRAPKIAILGRTGVGKSSTINALFQTNLPVGHIDPTTMQPKAIPVDGELIEGLNGKIVVYDMPGVDDDEDIEEAHIQKYIQVIRKADVAVWLIQAPVRGIRYDQQVLREILPYNPDIEKRLVIGINQVDLVHPNNWNDQANLPSKNQLRNIRGKEQRVYNKLIEICPDLTPEKVISFSAKKKYGLDDLFMAMMDACVHQRAWILYNRSALPDIEKGNELDQLNLG